MGLAKSSTAEKPLNELLTDEMVVIYVGPDKKKWTLHKDLLCARSSYFRVAFTGGFKETENKTMYLPEEEEAPFELLVGWLYNGDVKHGVDSGRDDSWTYIDLYLLASKFSMEALRNSAMDQIRAKYILANFESHREEVFDIATYISNHTLEGSPIRIWVAAAAVHSMRNTRCESGKMCGLYECITRAHPEFAVLAIQGLTNPRNLPSPYKTGTAADCAFHEHNESDECEE